MNKKDNQPPAWFVYHEQGELDIEKTLKALPENLDKNAVFFREVPEWFEVGPQEETQEILDNMNNIPEQERAKLTDKDIETMRQAFERLLHCQNIALQKDLTPEQRDFMRCVCYWVSLEAMNSIPLSPEDEENLVG